MRFRKVIALVSVASMILPGLAFAQAPSVNVTSPASCVAPQGTYKVTADIPGDVATARVLFRAEGTTCPRSEYYVDMRRGEGGTSGPFFRSSRREPASSRIASGPAETTAPSA